jgi:hypothetical protein
MIVFVEVGKVLLYVYSTKQTGVDILLPLYFFLLLYIVSASLICQYKVNYVFKSFFFHICFGFFLVVFSEEPPSSFD